MKKRKNLLFILSLSFAMLMGIGLNFVPMSSQAEEPGKFECHSSAMIIPDHVYTRCDTCVGNNPGMGTGNPGSCRNLSVE